VGLLRRHWLVVLGLVAIVGLVLAVNPIELARVFARTRPLPLLLMLPVTFAIYAMRSLGWWAELRRIGVPIRLPKAVLVAFAGQATIFVPGGDLGRAALLELVGAGGHDAGELTGTIAFQELMYLLLMGLATIPAVFIDPLVGFDVVALVFGEAGIFLILLWEPVYRWAVSTVVQLRLLRQYEEPLRHVRPAFLRLLRSRTAFTVLATNLLGLALAFLLFELALHAVGAERIGYAQAAFVYALAHVLGALSMLPGGLGIYEGAMTAFISLLGATPSEGAAAALLYRAFNDVLMALVGVGAGAVLKRTTARRQAAEGRTVPESP
jgi:uncharacterized membrane protein YbhN (UPF0104 family)